MKKLLAITLSLLMLVGCLPLASFAVSAEMGGDFPWTDTSEKMLVEEILERDGLIDGIWFPWFNGGETGHNLTGNDLMADYYNASSTKNWDRVELDYYGADKIYREIYNLKAMGYNMLAYGGSIMAEGVVFDANGDVTGVKEEYLNNVRRLLNICREAGMPVMWNVYFHCSSMPHYYGIDGWKVICSMLGNNEIADHYAENFVRPLCEVLAEYPDVVALVSIADEPENEINDIGMGNHYEEQRALYGVNQEDMVYFMQQINEVVREELPGVARTVASNSGNKTIYRDFDLDLMGHNQYTDGDSFKSVESLITDADPILTEYNIGSTVAYTDDEYAEKHITYRKWMINNGYKGGFQWCWMTNSAATTGKEYFLQRDKTDPTSFRKSVSLLKYYMDEYRAEYRGETLGLVAPVLYANTGDGVVKFIPSEKATKITVQRSDDGGSTWTTLASNLTQSDYVDEYLIGTYTDTTTRPDSGYCYRIIATDGTTTVTSEPNDLAGTDATFKQTYTAPTYTRGQYVGSGSVSSYMTQLTSFGVEANRPLNESFNLIENGSFESTDGQWNTSSFLTYASVVSDSTTPLGEKSLYFNTSNKSTAGWYTFTVTGLEADTDYTFSAFLKGAYLADNNKGFGSIGVIDPYNSQYMVYKSYYPRGSRLTQQMYPTAWDDEWHLRSVSFNSGSYTTVTIALYGYSSQMWVDGLALFESVNGGKYENGESSKAITTSAYSPASGATNAVTDPTISDESYWSAGAGYKQGFMSVTGGKLKYTASSDPKGVRYTKWIDVKPGTDYYVSYTVNVTTAGSGRVAILDNAKLLPNENLTQTFSSTGTKTVTGRISTGKYDQLGLCVTDLGGVATIDNVYLYEAGESVEIPTEPSYDGYVINGDFEIGSSNNWENLWNNNTVEMVEGRDSLFAMKGTALGQYTQVRQKIVVEPNTDYILEVWAKDVSGTTLILKDSSDSNLKQMALQGGSTWTKNTMEFNSGDNEFIYLGFMGSTAGSTYTVDDVTIYKKPTDPSNDGFIVNGDFEVGTATGWENVWGSNTVTIVDGYDSRYGMKVNAGQYTVVRESVAVEPNTDYIIEAWVKDCTNAFLLVKDSGDSVNILNESLPTGSTWTKVTAEFNSGSNTQVYVGFMGGAAGATYTVDGVTMYKKPVSEGLQNGDFESGEDSWTFGSGSHAIVSDAHGGNYALQLTNPSQWGSAAEQTIPVEPNTSYTITWWYKATPGTGTYNLYTMNADGYANLTAEGGQNYMNNYTGDWQKGTYVVNSGSATSIILKWSTEGTNPGTILIDDIVVTKTEDYVCTHSYTGAVTKQPTCAATGVRTYTCSLCGDSYTETIAATGAHTYDDVCDTDCNVCGTTRTAAHQYSGSCDQYCDLCGAKKTSFVIAMHSYENDCDADCDVCGYVRTVTGHTYDNDCDVDCNTCGTVREVSHTYDNACDTTCNVCGAIRTVSHSYKAVVTEPTCTAGGYTTYTCTVCGDSYKSNNTAATGHDYVGVVTQAPTCAAAGVKTYTCSDCDDSYTEAIAATGEHSYDNDCDADCNVCGATREISHDYVKSIVANANCGYDGMAKYTCSVCGDYYTEAIPSSGSHTYSNDCDIRCNVCNKVREVGDHPYVGVQTKAPTCTEAGEMTYTCSSCGDSYTETIAALGHTAGAAADCENAQTCTVCGEVLNAALGHDYKSVVTAPDCVNGGYTTYTCTACGDSYKDNYTTALGHTAGAAADCENAQTCTVCGEVLNEALGHDYKSVVTAPDCVNGGYTTYTCTACGDSYKDNYTTATGHTAGAAADCENAQTCTVCGEVLNEALGHDYKSVVTAPDCVNGGYTTYTCSSCGDSYTETIAALGHTAGAAADCENAQTCTVCGEVLNAALGHDYKSVVTAPDCVNGGYTTYTCTACGDSYKDNYTAALGHTAGAAADCENAQTCIVCGEVLNAALGHNYVGVETKAPTCGETGLTTYTCSVCGDSYTEEIAATGAHEYFYACDQYCMNCGEQTNPRAKHSKIHVEAKAAVSCIEYGNREYWYCEHCGAAWLDSTGRIQTNMMSVRVAGDCVSNAAYPCQDGECVNCGLPVSAEASHEYFYACDKVCSVCGEITNESAEHTVVAVEAVEATCTENGNVAYWYCSDCGAAWADEALTQVTNRFNVIVPAIDHTYSHEYDVDCDACGAIREVSLPIAFGGNSVSVDVSGLAFRFDVEVDGMTAVGTTAVYEGATVNGYKLISMGAIVSNGNSEKDVPAVYLCDLEPDSASFAVRVIKIPTDKYDVTITAIPYVVLEINGEEVTVYGETQASTFDECAAGNSLD